MVFHMADMSDSEKKTKVGVSICGERLFVMYKKSFIEC